MQNKHCITNIERVKIESKFNHEHIPQLKIIRLANRAMIIVNEVMKCIIVIYEYNAQFEMFYLFLFSNSWFNHTFISKLLIIVNVSTPGKECENINASGKDILIICNGNNYHNGWLMLVILLKYLIECKINTRDDWNLNNNCISFYLLSTIID